MYHLIDFCRLCLSFNGEFNNMCNDDVMEKVVACISDLEFDEKLPALICTKCSDQLDRFFDFRNQCLRSEFVLNCYISKFSCMQSCSKFVNTQLKVNVLKNFATSKKPQGNVQISEEISAKTSSNDEITKELQLRISDPGELTSRNSSLGIWGCNVISRDKRGSSNTSTSNNNQAEVVLDGSQFLSANNDVDANVSDEDDIFFEEEDEEEILQLENVNEELTGETENGKRKSDNFNNSLSKKARCETNLQVMNAEWEAEGANQVEPNSLNDIESDADIVPFNMQGDITEHVKLRKRKVQIRAQAKIDQALKDKESSKPGSRHKGTNSCRSKNSHSSTRSHIKNANLHNTKKVPLHSNTNMNNIATFNVQIDQIISDKLQDFNNSPVIHDTYLNTLIDVRLQSSGNLVTQNVKTNETNELETDPTISLVNNIEENKHKSISIRQDPKISSVFVSNMCESDQTVSKNLEDDFVTQLQHIINRTGIYNTEIDDIRNSKLQDVASPETHPQYHSLYMNNIQNIDSQTLDNSSATEMTVVHENENSELQSLESILRTRNTKESENLINALLQNTKIFKLTNSVKNKLEKTSLIDKETTESSTNLPNSTPKSSKKETLQADSINKPKGIETDIDYENNITKYCISNNVLPEEASSKLTSCSQRPFPVKSVQINTKKTNKLNKDWSLLKIKEVIEPKKDGSKCAARFPKKISAENREANITLTRQQTIPSQSPSKLNTIPILLLAPNWRKLYQTGETNKNSNMDSIGSSGLRSTASIVQTSGSVVYHQTGAPLSVADRSFVSADDEIQNQNPQALLLSELSPQYSSISPQKTKKLLFKKPPYNFAYDIIVPTSNSSVHDEKSKYPILSRSLLKNSYRSMEPKTNLFRTKNEVTISSKTNAMGNEEFEDCLNDSLNVETNLIIPLYSRDTLVNNSIWKTSNQDCVQLPTETIPDEYSLSANTTSQLATNLNPYTLQHTSLINENNDLQSIDTTEIIEPLQDIELKPSSIFDEQPNMNSEACIMVPVVEENYTPFRDHNYSSFKRNVFLSRSPSTTDAEFQSCSGYNNDNSCNEEIKKKSASKSKKVSRLLQNHRIQKKNSIVRRRRPKFAIDDPLNILKPIKAVSTLHKASRKILKKHKGSKSHRKNKRTHTGTPKQPVPAEKDEDFSTLEDSDIDVVTVSEPCNSSNVSCYPEADQTIIKNDAEKQRRVELRKYLDLLNTIVNDKIIPPHTVVSQKNTIDAAIHCIRRLKHESLTLYKRHFNELHHQNKLLDKFKAIKEKEKNKDRNDH